jgi:hypothetical protein
LSSGDLLKRVLEELNGPSQKEIHASLELVESIALIVRLSFSISEQEQLVGPINPPAVSPISGR